MSKQDKKEIEVIDFSYIMEKTAAISSDFLHEYAQELTSAITFDGNDKPASGTKSFNQRMVELEQKATKGTRFI